MSVELVKMLYFVGFSGEKYTFYNQVKFSFVPEWLCNLDYAKTLESKKGSY